MYYGYTSFYDIDVDDGLCDDVRNGMGALVCLYLGILGRNCEFYAGCFHSLFRKGERIWIEFYNSSPPFWLVWFTIVNRTSSRLEGLEKVGP